MRHRSEVAPQRDNVDEKEAIKIGIASVLVWVEQRGIHIVVLLATRKWSCGEHREGWKELARGTALNEGTLGRSSCFSGWKETKLCAYFNLHGRCLCLDQFTVRLRASGLSIVTVLDGGGPILGKSLCVGSRPSKGWVVIVNLVLALVSTSWSQTARVSSLIFVSRELGARRKPTDRTHVGCQTKP